MMKMTNPNSKQGMIFAVMDANADKPMDEVVKLILAIEGVPGKPLNDKDVRSTYLWAIRTGKAQGIGKTSTTRTRAPKAAKAPKAPRSKIVKVPAPRIAGDREKSGLDRKMTVEEMNDIKAKNMARMRAVAAKYQRGQYAEPRYNDEPFDTTAVPKLEAELDSFSAPAFLKMKDLKHVL
jgi:hypothetical protein